jgi:hypothetical protein
LYSVTRKLCSPSVRTVSTEYNMKRYELYSTSIMESVLPKTQNPKLINKHTTMTKITAVDKFKKGVYTTLDGPCSALALNCCQLGCFIHNVPIAVFDVHNNADWMQHLAQVNPDAKLRTLVLPGTHDSATATISRMKPFAAVGMTQNLSIFEQLNRGIRYLDIRMAGTVGQAEGVNIFHGCLMGAPLAQVLHHIATFLNEHPGEFLFLEFVCEYGREFSPSQKKKALDLIQDKLGSFLYKEDNKSKLLNEVSLKELIDSNTRVCAMVHNRIYEGFELDGVTYDMNQITETYSFFNSSRWMHNKWHNTRDDPMLLQWNLDEVHKRGSDRNKILANQFVLTPGVGGPADIVQLLIGMASLRPVSFAYRLIPAMEEFLRSNATEPWNIIMTDFVDLFPGLLSFLISLNFVATLEITKATIDSTEDVTAKIQPFIKRKKVLFLTNVRKDLELGGFEGTLTIEYKLNDETNTMEVEFDDDTEIVLSEYSRFVIE